MKSLLQELEEDQEVCELKKQLHDLIGMWVPYDWRRFLDIEDYKADLRYKIEHADEIKKMLEDAGWPNIFDDDEEGLE